MVFYSEFFTNEQIIIVTKYEVHVLENFHSQIQKTAQLNGNLSSGECLNHKL